MKAILAGVYLNKFLSIRAYLGKFIGVSVAIIGGLSMGRFGSFVHMSAVIAHQMAFRIKLFEDIGKSYSIRLSMYTASIAAGVCCSAGCPFGGVLFAMELTSTFYVVLNFWISSICALFTFFTYKLLH
jgi:H+/Cl- antiporter ClcA